MRRDIIRNIQPDDLFVITVPENTSVETAAHIEAKARSELVCYVMVVVDPIKVGIKRHWWQR